MSASLLFKLSNALHGFTSAHLPPAHRLVMLAYADYAHGCSDGNDGRAPCSPDCARRDVAWPSVAKVVSWTGLARSTVQACLADLRDGEWLEPLGPMSSANGSLTSMQYVVRATGKPVLTTPTNRGGKRHPPPEDRAMPEDRAPDTHARTSGPPCPNIGPPMPEHRAPHARTSGPPCPNIGPNPLRDPIRDPLSRSDQGSAYLPPAAQAGEEGPVAEAPPTQRPEALPPAQPARPTPPLEKPQAALFVEPDPAPRKGKASPKAKRDPSAPKASDLYADHYALGIGRALGEKHPPPTREASFLGQMAGFYGKGPGGERLTGLLLLSWFETTAEAYCLARRSAAQYEDGFSPRKCFVWLKAGRPGATLSGVVRGSSGGIPTRADEGEEMAAADQRSRKLFDQIRNEDRAAQGPDATLFDGEFS